MAEEMKPQIPYVPYSTFNNAIEGLVGTMPPRLDKSIWPSFSGAIQSQLWSTFKFFQFVNADGTPTSRLVSFVNADREQRELLLRDLLKEYYPTLMALDLSKATLGHFNEAMKVFGFGGETQKKASSFFIQAAKASGMELSPFILKNTRTPGVKRAKRNGQSKAKAAQQSSQRHLQIVTDSVVGSASTSPSRTIHLDNGIMLTLSTTADTFRMTPADRKFTNELLELLEKYVASSVLEADGDEEETED
jgi:hypothetical protein